jgi:UDP-N-acetylglucosamine--N-acetylmuramyl-(pentapeptide) pyrophosphoryl-undecaprenol N-acetylglucosamine transferase
MANAGMLEKAGGAARIKQASFSPEFLAAEIARLTADPATLPAMAAAARSIGVIDAADRLAELVLRVAKLSPEKGTNPQPIDASPTN